MNEAIRKHVRWARSQGWDVEDTSDGYTEFKDPSGNHVYTYPATPSNERRRIADLKVALNKAGLPWPPPSKKEQRSARRKAK